MGNWGVTDVNGCSQDEVGLNKYPNSDMAFVSLSFRGEKKKVTPTGKVAAHSPRQKAIGMRLLSMEAFPVAQQ